MIRFPNAKINIGLHVIAKRSDGFHDLETVFYPIPLTDILEVIPSRTKSGLQFTSSGISIPAGENICEKAFQLVCRESGLKSSKAVLMHLHKVIPMGAGLGGGSADGAFALNMYNQVLELNLSTETIFKLATELGSDCAFFLNNNPCFATGRGNILTPITLSLKGYHLLLVIPSIHVSTKTAYEGVKPAIPNVPLVKLISSEPKAWRNQITNDFEKHIFRLHPVLQEIKEAMYKQGAIYASMSGSGSSIFGLFEKKIDVPQFNNCFVRWLELK